LSMVYPRKYGGKLKDFNISMRDYREFRQLSNLPAPGSCGFQLGVKEIVAM
jgi:hypothetical protein